jgi:hypothetical protein
MLDRWPGNGAWIMERIAEVRAGQSPMNAGFLHVLAP